MPLQESKSSPSRSGCWVCFVVVTLCESKQISLKYRWTVKQKLIKYFLLVASILATSWFGGACGRGESASSFEDHLSVDIQFVSYHPMNMGSWTSPKVKPKIDGSLDVVLSEEAGWRLTRHWPSGFLDVSYLSASGEWTRLPLSLAWRRSQIPLLAFVSSNHKSFYLVTYDVVANLPSGRLLNNVREGLSLYEINPQSQGEPIRIAEALPLGGFDTRLFGLEVGDTIVLCGASSCLTIGKNGSVKPWITATLAGHEMIELAFTENGSAYALTRLRFDDNLQDAPIKPPAWYVALLSQDAAQVVETIADGGVPWGLTIDQGVPTLRQADDKTEMRALLRYELSLMPFNGVMDFGANNLDGRLAWSAAYYLNALISLVGVHSYLSVSERALIHERLLHELELVARLTMTMYPNLLSKRYSIDREPILVALHVGRVLQVIARAERHGIRSDVLDLAQHQMCETLNKLDTTLEEKKILQGGDVHISYRKGFPFWADGANVPYNYVSGIVSGLLEAGCISSVEVRRYLQPILINEFSSDTLPDRWRYWWGQADDGWTESDEISVNTPAYSGNEGSLAHISYRSMDATALILCGTICKLPKGFERHISSLIERGDLYPFLNESLARYGKRVPQDTLAALKYSRAVAPWEMQSQVWALSFLIGKDN